MSEFKLNELQARHSIRNFTPGDLSEDIRKKLSAEVSMINCHEAGLNFQLCFNDPEPFRGFTRSYGMFQGVRNYLAAVIDPSFPDTYERAGYFGEQFVMAAQRLGVGTCFVGGTFSSSHVGARMEVYEKLPFLIAFGIPEQKQGGLAAMMKKMMGNRKPDFRTFFAGTDAEYEEAKRQLPFLDLALQAVACAPSSLNKRPVRLKMVEEDGKPQLVAFTEKRDDKTAIDLGIAKCNVALAIDGIWNWGQNSNFEC